MIRVVIVYSFILYCMCALALTVLPLPSREAVAAAQPKPVGWVPFGELFRKIREIGLSFSNPASLKSKALWRRLQLFPSEPAQNSADRLSDEPVL